MALLKKNVMGQVLFTAVDKTDFATVESGLTSNFTAIVHGVNHGGSVASSDVTVSKTISVVKSGVFRCTLKPAETNFDFLMLKITHASAADQMIPIQTVTNDDEDMNSRLVLTQSNVSDIDSQLVITASQVLLMQSVLSDVDSQLLLNASVISDIDSQLVITASVMLLVQSNVSDIDSQLLLNASMISDIQSALDSDIIVRLSQFSDVMSNIDAVTATVTASDMSDIASRVWATAEGVRVDSRILVAQSKLSDIDSQVLLNASVISDVQSALDSDIVVRLSQFSDIMSNIDAVTATVTASDMSDIASRVVDAMYGATMSDFQADGTFGLAQNVIRANTATAGGASTITLDASAPADEGVFKNCNIIIVGGTGAGQARWITAYSAARVVTVDKIWDTNPDVTSKYVILGTCPGTNVVKWKDTIVLTGIRGRPTVDAEAIGGAVVDLSDIASAVWAEPEGVRVDSRILVLQSSVSDVDSQLLLNASVISDIQSALDSDIVVRLSQFSDVISAIAAGPAATVTASDISDIASAVVVAQASRLSDILSAAVQGNSRALVIQSMVSRK